MPEIASITSIEITDSLCTITHFAGYGCRILTLIYVLENDRVTSIDPLVSILDPFKPLECPFSKNLMDSDHLYLEFVRVSDSPRSTPVFLMRFKLRLRGDGRGETARGLKILIVIRPIESKRERR